jgi:O-antigen/teichoic acid export membrane protein
LNISRLKRHAGDPLYRNSIFLMSTTVVTTGLGFFFWMVVARYYTEYEVGVAAAIVAAVNLLALLSGLGFDAAIVRFLAKAEDPVRMINTCFTVTGIVALALCGVFLAGIDFFSPKTSFVREDPWFILAFIIFAFCWPISGLLDRVFIATRRAEFGLIKNTIFSLLKIPLPILLGLFFHAFGIVGSWGLAIAIAFTVSLLFFLPRVQAGYRPVPTIDLGIIRQIRGYAAGNYVVALFGAAPALLLPIIIVNMVSAEENAYFYMAWTMAGLLHAIPLAASFSLFAEASHFEDQLAAHARRALRFSVLLLVPAVALMALLGKWLLLVFGESYSSNALTLLWILAASSLPAAINDIYFSVLRVRGRIRELVAMRVFIAVSVLVTSAVASSLATAQTAMVIIGCSWLGANALAAAYVILIVKLRSRATRARRAGGQS